MKKRALIMFSFLVAFSILLATNAFAAYYTTIINKVITQSNGDVILELIPGTGEFRLDPLVRVFIDYNAPGAKSMIANALTAVALDSEVRVGCDEVPKLSPVYEAVGVTLELKKAPVQ